MTIESDRAAAELMGLKINKLREGMGGVWVEHDYASNTPWVQFSLANPADRMAFVEWLGENKGISIRSSFAGTNWYFWHEDWFGDRKNINDDCEHFDTPEQACRAAALWLKENG